MAGRNGFNGNGNRPPPGHQRFMMGGAYDLSAIATQQLAPAPKIWTCPKGHEYQSPQPFRIPIIKTGPAGPNQQTLITEALCPICLASFYALSFPAWEKGAEPPIWVRDPESILREMSDSEAETVLSDLAPAEDDHGELS